MAKFFDWLSNLRPRQLLALAGVSAIFIFFIMFFALTMISRNQIPQNLPEVTTKNTEGEEGTETTENPEVKMVSVVVAAKNIEPKSMLIRNLLETKDFPENLVPPDAVTDIAEVANKPARVRIYQGEVITHQKVYRTVEQSGFVASIPPDCRAVTIAVSDVTGVSGFAKPGDYVDVLLIEREDTAVTSRLILQDVLLLSINKNMGVERNNEGDENASSVNPATTAIDNPALATFALRPEEVLELIAASRLGEIYLMLRPLVPQSDYITGMQYTMQSLKARQKQPEGIQQPGEEPESAPPPVEKIEIIYGNKDEVKQNPTQQNEE